MSTTEATAAAPAQTATRFLGDRPRMQAVPLEWPIEVDGQVWTEIPCRRLTARELDAFYELPPAQRDKLPTIDAPARVLEELDADDVERVREVALGFLPQSWRTGDAPTPPTSA